MRNEVGGGEEKGTAVVEGEVAGDGGVESGWGLDCQDVGRSVCCGNGTLGWANVVEQDLATVAADDAGCTFEKDADYCRGNTET